MITDNPKTDKLIEKISKILENFQEEEISINASQHKTLTSIFTATDYIFNRGIASYLTLGNFTPEGTEIKLKEIYKDSRDHVLEMQKIAQAELAEIKAGVHNCKSHDCAVHGNRNINSNGNENLH